VSMTATGAAQFACASNGVLVHVPGDAETLRRTLVVVDRTGAVVGRRAAGDLLDEPRLAPDGASVIVGLRGRGSDLWRYDFAGGALSRLTFEGENFAGIWGPEAGTITFSSSRGGACDVYIVQPDRNAPP